MTTPTPKPGDRVWANRVFYGSPVVGSLSERIGKSYVTAADGNRWEVVPDTIKPAGTEPTPAATPTPGHEYVEAEDEQCRPCGYCGICGEPEGLCVSTAPAAGGSCCIGPFADGRHALNCSERCQDCGGDPDGPAACLARLRDLYETEQRLRRKADSELVKLKNLVGLDPAKWVPDEIPAASGSDTDDLEERIALALTGVYEGETYCDPTFESGTVAALTVVAPELARLRGELTRNELERAKLTVDLADARTQVAVWTDAACCTAEDFGQVRAERDAVRKENERLRGEQDVRAAVERVLDGALGDTLTPETGHGLASDVAVVVQQRDEARAQLAVDEVAETELILFVGASMSKCSVIGEGWHRQIVTDLLSQYRITRRGGGS